MNELNLKCSLEEAEGEENKILIFIKNSDNIEKNLLYKYIIGYNGTWSTLKDFTKEDSAIWIPEENGRYNIMVQAKKEDSKKPFDYVSRMDYIIRKTSEKLINEINVNKNSFKLGEKISLSVKCSQDGLLYRFLIKEGNEWKLIKDYSLHNIISISAKASGTQNIMVECKKNDSVLEFDDFMEITVEVEPIKKPEINKFRCISSELIAGSPILFQVDADIEEGRTTLYKFLKRDSKDRIELIKDFSTNNIISYVENVSGEYKLLCIVRDMYSQDEYDDRAIINYSVEPYKAVKINSFAANLNSPQLYGTAVIFASDVQGGNELLYRYIIEGNEERDTGYIRDNTFEWKCDLPGCYRIKLFVKDIAFNGEYEDTKYVDFVIDEKSREPARIDKVILDKNRAILKHETVNIKVIGSGSIDLRYSFIVRKNGNTVENVDYGSCDWVNFTPKECGNYELEVKVKDKYSIREFDSHTIVSIEVFNFSPASIEYILMPKKDYFVFGEEIPLQVISQNNTKNLFKYVIKINGHKVEETDFINSNRFTILPECSGLYTVEIFVRNKDSDRTFDAKDEVNILVNQNLPISNTKIICDKKEILCNEVANFTVNCEGGKEILYEFQLKEFNEWNVVQKFSKKSFYSLIPYTKGKYEVLALCKSLYSRSSYEDYDIIEFEVK